MPRPSCSRALAVIVPFLTLMVFAGCAAPEPMTTSEPEPPAERVARPYDIFLERGGRLYLNPGRTGEDVHVGRGGRAVMSSASPAGNAWVLALAGADSSRLYLFDGASGRVSLLHSGSADLAYTGVWGADGATFTFGYRSADWTGDIRTATLDTGVVDRVGCVSAKEVLGRRTDGSLIVRGKDNIYVVESRGCATLETLDARKMHHVSASPSGDRLAYVLRDLVYNREERSYEPDSSLYVRDWTGEEPTRIIGDRYSPRYPAWSPDGSELAYDVRLPDAPSTRSISIYTLETGRSSYLIPPAEGAPSRLRPRWSPRADHLLFEIDAGDGERGLGFRAFQDAYTQVIPLSAVGGSFERIEWPGPHHVVVSGPAGSMLFDLGSGQVVESGEDIVFVAREWSY